MDEPVRLSHLFIVVSDLERTRTFYVGALGLGVLMEESGYLRVGGAGGFHLGIEEGPPEMIGAAGIEIVVEVDDVDRRYGELVATGVTFDGPPEDQPWGARHAWLRDPDGYRLSIFSPTHQLARPLDVVIRFARGGAGARAHVGVGGAVVRPRHGRAHVRRGHRHVA